jgi:hypothetical protein
MFKWSVIKVQTDNKNKHITLIIKYLQQKKPKLNDKYEIKFTKSFIWRKIRL